MACSSCGKSIFDQAKSILSGAVNYTITDPEIEKVALPRLDICRTCINARVLLKVGDKVVLQCSQCKCLCELKVRSLTENCPINKW